MSERRSAGQVGRQAGSRAEDSFEVEEIEFDPTRRGYTQVPNYFKHFWMPLIGLKAAATYELLCSFAHGRKDECYPSVGLLADTLGVDKHDLTGRVRRDRRPGRRAEYYQKGMFEVLAEYGIAKATVEERNGTKHYRFKVLKCPLLLTPDQVARLPERLQRRHQELLARCQREREQFTRMPTVSLRSDAHRTLSGNPPVGAATGGVTPPPGRVTPPPRGGDAATLDLNTPNITSQNNPLSLYPSTPKELRERVRSFYYKIGQPRISRQKLEAGVKVLADLQAQGFNPTDITWATAWIASHQEKFGGAVHSLNLLPQVIGQALQEHRKVQREDEERQQQYEETQQHQREQARRQELEALYQSLPTVEQAALRAVAVENLLNRGLKKPLLLESIIRGEVCCLLKDRGTRYPLNGEACANPD